MYAYQHSGAASAPPTVPGDFAIARMLELARIANVGFEVADGRLVMRASRVNWKIWPAVRAYLDEIGTEALKAHVERGERIPLAA
jgi:hypothetical protein